MNQLVRVLVASMLVGSLTVEATERNLPGVIPNVVTRDQHAPQEYNVYYRGTKGLNLVGLVNLAKLKEILKPMGYTPVEFAPGKGAVNVVILNHSSVQGCTCPSAFSEYYIGALVKPLEKDAEGPFNVVRIFEGTNHIVRRAVMLDKFSSNSELSAVSVDPLQKTASIGMLSDEGEVIPVLSIKINSPMVPGDTAFDVVFRTSGGLMGDTELERNRYRFLGGGQSTKGLFLPVVDKITIHTGNKIGDFLKSVGFFAVQPEFYTSIDIDQSSFRTIQFVK